MTCENCGHAGADAPITLGQDTVLFCRACAFNLPRGAHVTYAHEGRPLLGEVVDVRAGEAWATTVVVVRHFNGEPWPVEPKIGDVRVLDREAR